MIIPYDFVVWVKLTQKKLAIYFFILYHETIRFNVSVFLLWCGQDFIDLNERYSL